MFWKLFSFLVYYTCWSIVRFIYTIVLPLGYASLTQVSVLHFPFIERLNMWVQDNFKITRHKRIKQTKRRLVEVLLHSFCAVVSLLSLFLFFFVAQNLMGELTVFYITKYRCVWVLFQIELILFSEGYLNPIVFLHKKYNIKSDD